MTLPSVLVVGTRSPGDAVALVLAHRGWEVVLTDPSPHGSDAVSRMREAGVEMRPGTALLSCFDLGTHVEAELSDGRVENFDLVVDTDSASGLPHGSRVLLLPASAIGDAAERWAQGLRAPGATA